MQIVVGTLFSIMRWLYNWTVGMSFWRMAFIAFLLRMFAVFPIGPLLALVMGTIWCIGNAGRILTRPV